MKRKNLLLFLTCYIAYTSIYIARLNLSMASPALKEAGILTTEQLGLLGSVFSVVYAAGRLVNGIISDRKPPWLMISAGLATAGVANLMIGLFPPFPGILLLWSANGFAQSMLWSAVLRVVSALYSEAEAKKKSALMVTSVAAGNILGILVSLAVIDRWGVRWAFVIPGAVTLVLAFAAFLALRRIPDSGPAPAGHISLFRLLQDRQLQTAACPAALHGLMRDNVTLWMTVFFVDRYGVQLNRTAGFVLLIPVLGFIGRILYPVCYRLCGNQEHKVSQYGFLLCAASSALLCFSRLPPAAAMISLSLIYAAVSLINTSFLSIYPIRFASCGNIASVSGLMDFVTYLGAGIGSLAYGFVIRQWGYMPMFFSWAILSVLSSLLLHRLIQRERNA